MPRRHTKGDVWVDLDAIEKRIAALERMASTPLPTSSSDAAMSGTIYIDDIDGKTYFKDAGGVSHALY